MNPSSDFRPTSPSETPDPLRGLDPALLMAQAGLPTDAGADSRPLNPADLPGQAEIAAAFPDLEVLELIGHGGMSAVFRARQRGLDRVVALKVLPKSLASRPGFAERFTREGRALAKLSHPGIVAVHEFGERGGFFFLALEYVDGVNLRQAMRAGKFTPEQALAMVPTLCDALQAAHAQGVLHRDIKPENILLDTAGRVKIADFGIAKLVDEAGGDQFLTQSGARLGTAPYMAPEQIEKPSTVDHRADIYSLGVVFYELLTGELPLGRFAPPSELAAVGGGLDEVVFRALAKEREKRQQSALEFKTQIQDEAGRPGPAAAAPAVFEYKSRRTFRGRPLVHVVFGPDPETGRFPEARGFFACGPRARGVFALGGVARGVFACGGAAWGVVTVAGAGAGLVSVGGFVAGAALAWGCVAVGALAHGVVALGWHAAGVVVFGWHGVGVDVHAHQGFGLRDRADGVPPLTLWLHGLTDARWFQQTLVFAVLAVGLLVPWLARKKAGPGLGRAAGVLCLVLAQVVLCALWGFVGLRWPGHIGPALVCAAGGMMCSLALPLWLRLVPRNRWCGVNWPFATVTERWWLDVNAQFGKNLFGWSVVVMGAGLAGFFQLSGSQSAYPWAALALIFLVVGATVLSNYDWARRILAAEDTPDKPRLPLTRRGRLLQALVIAAIAALFVRSFIAKSIVVRAEREPGAPAGSRWLASKLDTGWQADDLVFYEGDDGREYVARVVRAEKTGLILKSARLPEPFPVSRDKISGKLLFSYFPRPALPALPTPPAKSE